ncbi:MAG: hypothetical protein O7A98_10885, partial [Acidobacteria bacterium]|nr:hypothetical protein [Acidobacteriota bacterium]
MISRRRLLILAVLVVPALGIGVLWTFEHVGRVPTYADTHQYLRAARQLKVDEYRGIAYPGLLAVVDRLHPGPSILARRAPGQSWIQASQMALCAGALTYFVAVLLPFGRPAFTRGGQGGRWALGLLVLLLLLDPLVSHFNLSLMPDALALSGSLVFCAAFVDFLRRSSPVWVSGALLSIGYLVLANTRAEKNFVLLATGLTTIAITWWLGRRRYRERLAPASRLLAAAAIIALGFAATMVVQRATYKPRGRMTTSEWILHHRIIYPHLSAVYERLPDHLKRQIPPRQARRYDLNISSPRRVLKTISLRIDISSAFTRELAVIVAREYWPAIGLDIVRDTGENVFASLSFYFRLGALAIGGEETSRAWFPSGGSRYTYTKLAEVRPALSLAYLASAAILLLAAIFASILVALRKCPKEESLSRQTTLEQWLPVASFCLFNALAFSLTADLVHIRYTLFAHTVFLALALRGLAEWAIAARPVMG